MTNASGATVAQTIRTQARRLLGATVESEGEESQTSTALKLPKAMKDQARWVRRHNRRPITVKGTPASSTNPKTWATFAEARDAKPGNGIGFMLGGGIGCIDLDHCIEDGELLPWANDILARCPDTYVEVSLSGTGLHIFGKLPPAPGRGQRGGDHIEFYSRGRHIAVTGIHWNQSPNKLADLSEVVATL